MAAGGGRRGGGAFNNGGTLNVIGSAVTGNTANGNSNTAGGIDNSDTVNVTNSTLSGNFANGAGGSNGGAIWAGAESVVTLTNSTITNNTAAGPNSASGVIRVAGTVTARNTIIAANVNNSSTPDTAGDSFTSQGYNLVGNPGAVTAFNQTGDQTGNSTTPLDPKLGPLASNGGPTQTHALLPGSPAIDKGSAVAGMTTDQRGLSRPFDEPSIPNAAGGDGSDIGAFEALSPTASGSEIAGTITTANGTPIGGVVLQLGGTTSTFTITDLAGHYRFADLDAGGFYTVTPQLVNYGFSPAARSFSLVGNTTEAAFTAVPDDVARANPLDTPEYFVRQQYLDFLGREPDQAGLAYWVEQINSCNGDAGCMRARRIAVSNAFFHEQEYQRTGSYVFRLYRAAFGNSQAHPNPDSANPTEAHKLPSYAAFAVDRGRVIGGATLAQSQLALANAFVQRREFADRYPASLDGPGFVDSLLATIRNDSGAELSSQRLALIDLYNAGGRNVLYRLADDNPQTNPVDTARLLISSTTGRLCLRNMPGTCAATRTLAGFSSGWARSTARPCGTPRNSTPWFAPLSLPTSISSALAG